jgi:hypothetical protein
MTGVSISFDGLTSAEARYLLEALDAIRGTSDHSADAIVQAHQTTYNHMTGAWDAQTPATDYLGQADILAHPHAPAAHTAQSPAHAPAGAPAAQTEAGVDAVGIAWRADIHSSSRKLAADGSWALRRGYPEAQGKAYKDEFKRRKQLGDTLHATHAPAPSVPAGDQFGHLGMSTVSPAAPTAAQLNAQFQAPPVPQSYAAPAIDYPTWHALYGRMHAAGKIDEGMYNWMNQQAGVTDINEYYTNATARQLSYGVLQQLELA